MDIEGLDPGWVESTLPLVSKEPGMRSKLRRPTDWTGLRAHAEGTEPDSGDYMRFRTRTHFVRKPGAGGGIGSKGHEGCFLGDESVL